MTDRENDRDIRGRQEALRSEAKEPVTVQDKEQLQEQGKVWKTRIPNKTENINIDTFL